jgi:UDP-glucose 4-epimerase
MHILVTGGASFIGSHIIEHLTAAGHEITTTVLHRKFFPKKCVKVRNINLANLGELDTIQDIDLIVHCAASLPLDGIGENDFTKNNIVATRNVLNFANENNVKKVIMCSSMAVYGKVSVSVVDHKTPPQSPDLYGLSKLSAEQIASTFKKNVSCIALRLPGVLGKGAHDAFLPSALRKIKCNLPVTISNPDSPFNNLVHVEDLVLFISHLTFSDWSGFHAMPIASLEHISTRRAIEIMAKACGHSLNLEIIASNNQPFCIDDSKARSMGYKSQNTEDAIHRFATEVQ